jgi:NitT/TauT family transport system permease protein
MSITPRPTRRRRLPRGDLSSWTVFGMVMLLGWEAGSRLYGQPYLLPAPSQIAGELAEHWPLVLDYALITTQEVVVGFALGSVAALLTWLCTPRTPRT